MQPVDTEFGRKTRIDQTSCNTDYSCLDGDCPSFVTVELPEKTASSVAGAARPQRRLRDATSWPRRSSPTRTSPSPTQTQNVFLAGIGGTGIVTVNQVLGTAALRAGPRGREPRPDRAEPEGRTGRVAPALRTDGTRAVQPADPRVGGLHPRLRPAHRDRQQEPRLRLAGADRGRRVDQPDPDRRHGLRQERHATPTRHDLLARLRTATREVESFDALGAAEMLFGNTAAANFLLVGAAFQSGGLRIPAAAIEEAIEINGVAVASNLAAFQWGRAAIAAPTEFAAAVRPVDERPRTAGSGRAVRRTARSTGEVRRLVELRAAKLVEFQDLRLAARVRRRGHPGVDRGACRHRAHRVHRGGRAGAAQAHRVQGRVRGRADARRPDVPRRRRRAGAGRRAADLQAASAGAEGDGPQEEDRVRSQVTRGTASCSPRARSCAAPSWTRSAARTCASSSGSCATTTRRPSPPWPKSWMSPATTVPSRSPGCPTWSAATRRSSSRTSRSTASGSSRSGCSRRRCKPFRTQGHLL